MNMISISGRIVRDVDIRRGVGKDGKTDIARFTVAVRRPRTKDGASDFVRCVCFGTGKVKFVEDFLTKGCRVEAQGRLMSGSYVNKDGQKIYTTEICVAHVEFGETLDARLARSNRDEAAA